MKTSRTGNFLVNPVPACGDDGEVIIECAYCSMDVYEGPVPDPWDLDSWAEEKKQHASWCEWALTHAHTDYLQPSVLTCGCAPRNNGALAGLGEEEAS